MFLSLALQMTGVSLMFLSLSLYRCHPLWAPVGLSCMFTFAMVTSLLCDLSLLCLFHVSLTSLSVSVSHLSQCLSHISLSVYLTSLSVSLSSAPLLLCLSHVSVMSLCVSLQMGAQTTLLQVSAPCSPLRWSSRSSAPSLLCVSLCVSLCLSLCLSVDGSSNHPLAGLGPMFTFAVVISLICSFLGCVFVIFCVLSAADKIRKRKHRREYTASTPEVESVHRK